METAAAFLETRRFAALKGATTEFTKMEGQAINKKDRKHAGPSVPAHGLYLQNVLYETDVYI